MSSASGSNTAAVAANSGLSTGARAGIGIGVSLGAIALIGLGVFIHNAMQWRKRARLAAPVYEVPDEYAPKEVYGYLYEGNSAQLPGMESAVHEMPGTKIISELHAASPRR
jgi:tetrahydrodipicolinate N-succinyltransferase